MDSLQLIPKDKHDVETAEKLFQYTYEETKPIVPQLLTWIQDGNWPVSKPVFEFLQTIAPYITGDIVDILRSDDSQWKYWCIILLLNDRKDLDPSIIQELRLLATTTNPQDIEEGVSVLAEQLLAIQIS